MFACKTYRKNVDIGRMFHPKKMNKLIILLLFLTGFSCYAQNTVTIGNGTSSNFEQEYPAPYGNWYWGARHQILIRAPELIAQGMVAGNITAIAFNVASASGTALTNFGIRIKTTTANAVNGNFDNAGFTPVWGPQNYTETTGWNTHTFSTPFYWNGTSHILIETCFNNTSFTTNASMYFTNTPFNSVACYYEDAGGICSINSGTTYNRRPNIRITYSSPNNPPVANFSANPTYTCSGSISFTDLSSQNPTSWLWDFGDGNTSTQQNPTHTYSANGNYTVSLTATNPFGNNTKTESNYITVNLSGQGPVPASCIPLTGNGSFGFGITNFSFNTINKPSGNASEGYSDFTCYQTSVYAGKNYTISIVANTPAQHNIRAWIDFNNDGVFNASTELVFSEDNILTASGTVFIPQNAVKNTPLRLRISADYNLINTPGPCTNPEYGQAEDYTVIVLPNTFPPEAAFVSDKKTTCDGIIAFTDVSQNTPTYWLWDFGDGNFSVQKNPVHTYTLSGDYSVTLIVGNSFGSDTIALPNYITVNLDGQLKPANCSPSTLSYCCGYGTFRVIFNTIDNVSGGGEEGYQDFSCQHSTTIEEGKTYNLSLKTGSGNSQDTWAWIDFNNDGMFSSSELVFQKLNTINPAGNITIPSGAIHNTPLRMRISSDFVGSNLTSCTSNAYGQTEDYAVIITHVSGPPMADFIADKTTTCDGVIQFTDLSQGLPVSWNWNFGDGNMSVQQHPAHTYQNNGIYTVSLTVSNAMGLNDTSVKTNYINVNNSNFCDTVLMPVSGTVPVLTSCTGIVMDDGGNNNYSEDTYGNITIAPIGASSVVLFFSMFDFEDGYDFLSVFDGPSTASPLIGRYTGNSLPNGGTIISTGGAITLLQETDFIINMPGFITTWSCNVGINEPAEIYTISVYPNPVENILNVLYEAQNPLKQLQIVNFLGEIVFEETVQGVQVNRTIDVSGYAKGIYLIKFISDDEQQVRKIIIK
jgi:PKD repeat protein